MIQAAHHEMPRRRHRRRSLTTVAAAAAAALSALSAAPTTARGQSADTAPTAAAAAAGNAGNATGLRVRYFPLAAPFYKPETRIGAAATVTAVARRLGADSADRPSSANVFVIVTQQGQLETGLSGELWTPGNRVRAQGAAGFARFPLDFYGVGTAAADAVKKDSAESYTPTTVSLQLATSRRVRRATYVGAGYQLFHTQLTKREPGGILAAGDLPGSVGGTLSALSLLGSFDTRDNLYSAARGSYVQLVAGAAHGAILSEFDFARLTVDARKYVTLRPGQVAAVQLVADAIVSGDAPFDRLPQIGGQSVVRGYYQGKYRDRNAAALQAEYRAPLWGRLGLVTFAGAGVVTPRLSTLRAADVRTGYGAGLRVALSKQERVNLRADYGVGRDGGQLYLTLGEAF